MLLQKKKSIVEKSVFRSNEEEKKGNFTQAGYSFIYGHILDSS